MSSLTEHVFRVPIPLRWSDLDAFNHVNNARYLTFLEQARIEWLESFGFGTSVTLTEGPVIVNASCTFLIPFTYPGTIDCRMFSGHPGRSSVPTHYELRLVGEDRIYAEGAAKLVQARDPVIFVDASDADYAAYREFYRSVPASLR